MPNSDDDIQGLPPEYSEAKFNPSELLDLWHKQTDLIKKHFLNSEPAPKPTYDYSAMPPAPVLPTAAEQLVPHSGYQGIFSALGADRQPPASAQVLPPSGAHGIFSAMNPRADGPAPQPTADNAWHPPMALPGMGGDRELADGDADAPKGHAPYDTTTPFHPREMNMDLGQNDMGSVANLSEAQSIANNAKLGNQLGRAAELIGSGISHTAPVAQKIFDEQAKQSDDIVKDYQARVAQQKDDPNSPMSKMFKQYAQKLGVNIKGDFTAAEGEKMLPFMFKDFEAQQMQDFKDKELKYKTQELGEQKRFHDLMLNQTHETAAQAKLDKAQTDKFATANSQWEKLIASGRGGLGSDFKKVQGADALDAFVSQYKDLNKVTPEMEAEFVSLFNNLTTGGQGSDVKFNKIMPKNLPLSAAKAWQWLSNTATPAQQGSFLQQFIDSAHAQKAMSEARLKEEAIKFAEPMRKHWGDDNINNWYQMRGVNPDEIEQVKTGKRLFRGGAAASESLSPKDQTILDTFKQNNPNVSPEAAMKALRAKGYIQ